MYNEIASLGYGIGQYVGWLLKPWAFEKYDTPAVTSPVPLRSLRAGTRIRVVFGTVEVDAIPVASIDFGISREYKYDTDKASKVVRETGFEERYYAGGAYVLCAGNEHDTTANSSWRSTAGAQPPLTPVRDISLVSMRVDGFRVYPVETAANRYSVKNLSLFSSDAAIDDDGIQFDMYFETGAQVVLNGYLSGSDQLPLQNLSYSKLRDVLLGMRRDLDRLRPYFSPHHGLAMLTIAGPSQDGESGFTGKRKGLRSIKATIKSIQNPDGWLINESEVAGGQNPAALLWDLHALPQSAGIGMGVPYVFLDEQSFKDAAATLSAEGIGLSFEWSAGDPVALANRLLDVIAGFRVIDPDTGKTGITLLRPAIPGHDPFPVIDESNTVSVRKITISGEQSIKSIEMRFTDISDANLGAVPRTAIYDNTNAASGVVLSINRQEFTSISAAYYTARIEAALKQPENTRLEVVAQGIVASQIKPGDRFTLNDSEFVGDYIALKVAIDSKTGRRSIAAVSDFFENMPNFNLRSVSGLSDYNLDLNWFVDEHRRNFEADTSVFDPFDGQIPEFDDDFMISLEAPAYLTRRYAEPWARKAMYLATVPEQTAQPNDTTGVLQGYELTVQKDAADTKRRLVTGTKPFNYGGAVRELHAPELTYFKVYSSDANWPEEYIKLIKSSTGFDVDPGISAGSWYNLQSDDALVAIVQPGNPSMTVFAVINSLTAYYNNGELEYIQYYIVTHNVFQTCTGYKTPNPFLNTSEVPEVLLEAYRYSHNFQAYDPDADDIRLHHLTGHMPYFVDSTPPPDATWRSRAYVTDGVQSALTSFNPGTPIPPNSQIAALKSVKPYPRPQISAISKNNANLVVALKRRTHTDIDVPVYYGAEITDHTPDIGAWYKFTFYAVYLPPDANVYHIEYRVVHELVIRAIDILDEKIVISDSDLFVSVPIDPVNSNSIWDYNLGIVVEPIFVDPAEYNPDNPPTNLFNSAQKNGVVLHYRKSSFDRIYTQNIGNYASSGDSQTSWLSYP